MSGASSFEAFHAYRTAIGADVVASGDRIASIAAWGVSVYVGTKLGFLYQYVRSDLNASSPSGGAGGDGAGGAGRSSGALSTTFDLVVKKTVVAKKPVTQLQVRLCLVLNAIVTSSSSTFHLAIIRANRL